MNNIKPAKTKVLKPRNILALIKILPRTAINKPTKNKFSLIKYKCELNLSYEGLLIIAPPSH
jgi:hypothetical protein